MRSSRPPSRGTTTAQGGGVNEAAKSHEFDWGKFTLTQRVIDKAAAGEPLNIVVSTIGTAIPVFGVEQQIGVDRGCEANGDRGLAIECSPGGPASTDATAQLAELQTLLTSDQVDCLGFASPHRTRSWTSINQYVDAGIPVFTQNTDVPNSKRFAFFALNERDAARRQRAGHRRAGRGQGPAHRRHRHGIGRPRRSSGRRTAWAASRRDSRRPFPDADFQQDEKTRPAHGRRLHRPGGRSRTVGPTSWPMTT